MDEIKNIISLAEQTSQGNYDIEEVAIGVRGYGFVLRDLFKEDNPSFITGKYSSRICTFTQFRAIRYLLLSNLHYIGRLKTLLPSIELGGYYHFFSIWVFVITPDKKQFPIIFYYGKNGYAFGGWDDLLFNKLLAENKNDEDLISFIERVNYSPFNMTQDELQALIENLLSSLKIIPVSEFWGIIERESHKTLLAYLNNKDIVGSYPADLSDEKILKNINIS